jgi:hypothetical protein
MASAALTLPQMWASWKDDRKVYRHYFHVINQPYESWQLDDFQFIDEETECCILRSRKASKTTDLVNWLIKRLLQRPWERWGWFASKSGQLVEAFNAIQRNPFFTKKINIINKTYIILANGTMFAFGTVTTSALGLNLDGMIFDEEQDLERPNQEKNVYPQFFPMVAPSPIHKIIHTGTRWINTAFDDECDQYPCRIRDWQQAPWLVKSGFVEDQIKKRPKWEIDLLYRCLRTTPAGLVWTNWKEESVDTIREHLPSHAGIDINALEIVVEGTCNERDIWITGEWEGDYINNPNPFDALKTLDSEVEDGGFNWKLARIMQSALGCKKCLWDSDKKSERMEFTRMATIHMNRTLTPNIFKDITKCEYDPRTGLYYKDPVKNPCHYLDAFLHMTHPEGKIFRPSDNKLKYGVGMDAARLRHKLMNR